MAVANNQLRIDDMGWSSSLVFLFGVKTLSPFVKKLA
jgi:hypothetical protein